MRFSDVDPQVAPAAPPPVEAVLESGEHIVSLAVPRPDGHGLLLNVFPIRDAGDAVVQVGCLYSDAPELNQERMARAPILELDDRVLVAPLVGEMDPTGRVRQLTGRLLQAITDTPRSAGDLRRDGRPGDRLRPRARADGAPSPWPGCWAQAASG